MTALWIILGVLPCFREWRAKGGEEPAKKTGFAALGEFEREMGSRSPAPGAGGDPVCGTCQTTYNRQEVIGLIRQQSPETFEFSTWTTTFVCKVCRAEIVLSGSRGE